MDLINRLTLWWRYRKLKWRWLGKPKCGVCGCYVVKGQPDILRYSAYDDQTYEFSDYEMKICKNCGNTLEANRIKIEDLKDE